MNIKIVLADDHPIVLLGIRMALEDMPGLEICGEAADSTGLAELLDRVRPDVLISDFYMPGGKHGDGLTLILYVKRKYPEVKLIILTMMTNPLLLENILEAGGDGILLKSGRQDEVADAVRAVAAGGKYLDAAVKKILDEARLKQLTSSGDLSQTALSKKESEVLRLFVGGNTVSEIALMLHRSVKTISHQKIAAQQKLGISSDKELYEYAMRNGLL
ncbi:response regulator [Jeongeupia chitinilytica]|uniref:DNA-binding response regulator n=1 Tax=Jeongeupia chitinilytica TaxID=1041641 RepID=A0ABQ3GZF8_9NEIS|nr:response regulator [Jeongeupia chitinilytica]GHD62783.1 DNA-binding response regulator [Jeongeupia chitinilytica]